MIESVNEYLNKNSKKYLLIFFGVFILVIASLGYYYGVLIPKRHAAIVPNVVEERSYITSEEHNEMSSAYKEVMKRKYDIEVNIQMNASSSHR